jgi:hypothetical protein
MRLGSFIHRGLVLAIFPLSLCAQVDESELGAWYMYMWTSEFDQSRYGLQGDIQYRNWDAIRDLEQLLIRGGATWSPEGRREKYTLGYAYVASGAYGKSSATSNESRIYQEALIPRLVGRKFYLTHRFRLEQRWIEGQDFRSRLRYFFALNVPFNKQTLGQGALYLSFYNELFVNLERDIGDSRRVDAFDRNRTYLALGYGLTNGLRFQMGYMYQKTETIGKGQLQFGLVQNF